MKQTPLKRGKPLARKAGLRSKPKPAPPAAERAARTLFKGFYIGRPCASCRLLPAQVTHHVVLEQYLKGMDKWRLDNAMALCRGCHNNHHSPNGPKLRRDD